MPLLSTKIGKRAVEQPYLEGQAKLIAAVKPKAKRKFFYGTQILTATGRVCIISFRGDSGQRGHLYMHSYQI